MNKELILQEEKEYWQAEALKARDRADSNAAQLLRECGRNKVLEDLRTENICKLAAITNLAELYEAHGITMPAINYNTTSALELQSRVTTAMENVPKVKKPEQEYILMAWRGSGGFYADTRALSAEDNAKLIRIGRQKKVALYAMVVK